MCKSTTTTTTPRGYAAIEGYTVQYKEVPNRSPHVGAVHVFQLQSRFGRSQPLSLKLPALRASANDAFALICAIMQALSPLLRLRKRPLVAVNTGIILWESHSLVGIFSNLDTKMEYEIVVHLGATLSRVPSKRPGPLEIPALAALSLSSSPGGTSHTSASYLALSTGPRRSLLSSDR